MNPRAEIRDIRHSWWSWALRVAARRKLPPALPQAWAAHSLKRICCTAPEISSGCSQGIGLGDERSLALAGSGGGGGARRAERPVVIACSALKRRYRDFLRERLGQVRFVFLHGSPDIIAERLASRRGHFATASLLESQLAALEPPGSDEDAVGLDIRWSLDQLTESAARAYGGGCMKRRSAGSGPRLASRSDAQPVEELPDLLVAEVVAWADDPLRDDP